MGNAASMTIGRPRALLQAGQDRALPPDLLLGLELSCQQYRAAACVGMIGRRHRSLEATCQQ